MRETPLPQEFAALQGKVNYVQRITAGEWSSSCPQCGGIPHRGGEFPDRFRMWTNATGKNRVMGWCRRCSYTWFPDHDRPMSRHEFEQWRKDALAAEQRRKAEAERAIRLLKSEHLWERYHNGLTEWSISVLKGWGIRKDWADYWKLGFYPDYKCYGQDGGYYTPAITIPVWQFGWDLRNIKVRTLNPKRPGDRYRALYKVGQDYPFVAFPVLKSDTLVLVEGEKKAMVVAEWSDQKYQVVGVPTKTPSPESLKMLDGFGKIYVILDPDARQGEENPQKRMVNLLGRERCAVVNLPGKVDDMMNENGFRLQAALRYARMEA